MVHNPSLLIRSALILRGAARINFISSYYELAHIYQMNNYQIELEVSSPSDDDEAWRGEARRCDARLFIYIELESNSCKFVCMIVY